MVPPVNSVRASILSIRSLLRRRCVLCDKGVLQKGYVHTLEPAFRHQGTGA